jgi:uroporphyrinogen-III decarboxylase
MAVEGMDQSGNPLVFIPLHKGADGFMSPAQFEKFYWPTLKRVMDMIVEAGGVPVPFAEGGYSQRIDCMKDMPKGSTAWIIDKTDMVELKKRVGDHCCLIGNVPGSMFHSGSPADIEQYCRNLIDKVGPGGGFMMASGTVLDEARPEMIHAMLNTTFKYGQY